MEKATAPRTWPTAGHSSWPSTASPGESPSRSMSSNRDEEDEYMVEDPMFYPSWKTVSIYPTYVAGDDDDEDSSLQHEENATGNYTGAVDELKVQAVELEKQTADLKAAAQVCRDLSQGYQNAPAAVPKSPVYAFVLPPVVVLPWEQAPAAVPVIPMPIQRPSQYAQGKTTVMWRNLPNNYSRDDLLKLLDSEGFAGAYDFFYSPMDFTSNALVGYAFVNFVNSDEADRFFYHFQGFKKWSLMSDKVSEVTWSHPLQGLDGHIERYRNSPVMHTDVSDARKPVLFRDGQRVPFPEPTRKLRAPHLKECRPRA